MLKYKYVCCEYLLSTGLSMDYKTRIIKVGKYKKDV